MELRVPVKVVKSLISFVLDSTEIFVETICVSNSSIAVWTFVDVSEDETFSKATSVAV